MSKQAATSPHRSGGQLEIESSLPMPEVIVDVDPRVYRLSAIKKAAYRFGDRCFVQIETTDDGPIRVTLSTKSDTVTLDTLAGDFRNELLDQDLRESIAEETEGVRNLLLAHAFSGLSLADPVAETADFREDPLAIGRPQAASQGASKTEPET